MEWQIDALSYGQLAHLHYFREVNDAHFNHCLQMHTYYSDGKYSPAELLHYAASIGLETMAIADHDNANGVREALPLAQELGIDLAPSIEFACCWNHCDPPPGTGEIDVLSYFIA